MKTRQQKKYGKLDESKDIIYTLSNQSYPIINISGSSEVDDINAKIQEDDDKYTDVGFKYEYEYYLNNEILSLIRLDFTYGSSITREGYYDVFNINVNTGKVVSNSDLLKIKNIDEQTFLSKLPECYKNKFLELRR